MAYYTNYKGRRALGARYSKPPEVILDEQRLAQEYALAPERARLAEQKRQNNLKAIQYGQERKDLGTASMVGAGFNTAGLGLQAYKAGLFKTAPTVEKTVAPLASQGIAPLTDAASGMAGAATDLSAEALAPAMEAGVDISGSIIPNTVAPATTGLLSGIASGVGNIANYASPAGYGMAAKAVAQPAFANLGKEVTNLGGVSKYAGEGINKFLAEPMEKATLEGATSEMTRNVVEKISPEAGNVVNSWQAKVVTDIFDPVGTVLDTIKKGGANLIGSLIGGMSWLCTETKKVSYMTDDERKKMDFLKDYALTEHSGWMKSYLLEGPYLIKAISEQEQDLDAFYTKIRCILIEPVCNFVESDVEQAFQIYLMVTKMLFKTYMPDFRFKEVE